MKETPNRVTFSTTAKDHVIEEVMPEQQVMNVGKIFVFNTTNG